MKRVVNLAVLLSVVSCTGVDQAGQTIGQVAEGVGRIPRILGNAALGTKPETKQDTSDLEDKVDALEELLKVSLEVLSGNVDDIESALSDVDSDLAQAISEEISDVYDEIESSNEDIDSLLDLIEELEEDIEEVGSNLEDLEAYCRTRKYRGRFYTSCELSSEDA